MKETSEELSNFLKVIPNTLTHERVRAFLSWLSKQGGSIIAIRKY